jgi:hypothetical protein
VDRVQLPGEEHTPNAKRWRATSIPPSIEAETFQCTVSSFNIWTVFVAFRAHCSNF